MTIQPYALPGSLAAASLNQFRQQSPLIHCLTNQVVQSFTANVLLAVGASPAMVVEPEEATQFSALADGLLVNIGTLHAAQAQAILAAIHSANQAAKPWILDPVAVGGLDYRRIFAEQLLSLRPRVIRGNASEIMALSGFPNNGRGVDSGDETWQALPAAQQLAQQVNGIVVVSGATDYITDGQRIFFVTGGSPLMTRIVGTGCALSAVVTAFATLSGDGLQHVASACQIMSYCGGLVADQVVGPGSFVPMFLDVLYQLCPEDLQ